MKRYKVFWTEKHSLYVTADSHEAACQEAMGSAMAPSCDYQTLDDVDELESVYDGPDTLAEYDGAA